MEGFELLVQALFRNCDVEFGDGNFAFGSPRFNPYHNSTNLHRKP